LPAEGLVALWQGRDGWLWTAGQASQAGWAVAVRPRTSPPPRPPTALAATVTSTCFFL